MKRGAKCDVGQQNNWVKKGKCVCVCACPSTSLTSSTVDTVLRQSLILDWKLDVPGEDRSSLVRTTKSEILIRSGMFRAKRSEGDVRQSVESKVSRSVTRAPYSHWKRVTGSWQNNNKKQRSPLVAAAFGVKKKVARESDPRLLRLDSAARVCAHGGAAAVARYCPPIEGRAGEGANSIITWECLRSPV